MKIAALLALSLAGCATATPPTPPVDCRLALVALPAEFAAWTAPRAMTSATAAAGLGAASLRIGEAAELTLHPDGQVTYVTLPKGAGEAASFGGLAKFTVTRAGRYSVAMSRAAWVDVSREGLPTEAAEFGPGPACTPLRKIVSFDLQTGDYVLELSGNATADIHVMIAEGWRR